MTDFYREEEYCMEKGVTTAVTTEMFMNRSANGQHRTYGTAA
jgi:hypothetical protein